MTTLAPSPTHQPEISIEQVRIVAQLIRSRSTWMTNRQLAREAGVAPRTARLHTRRLSEIGVLERDAVAHGGHRFRVVADARRQNAGYFARLTRAAELFGIPLEVPAPASRRDEDRLFVDACLAMLQAP